MIPYGRQWIDLNDLKAVSDALQSDYLTTGPAVETFESAFAKKVGARYAVAVSNGTAALHLACLAAELNAGEEVVTSAITFAASANCALYCGATPRFCDTNSFGLMDAENLSKHINTKTKIIIPVHLAGASCSMQTISKIAKESNLVIIEDAAHALAAQYKGSPVGSCQYSDMTIFSLHPVKHITSGEGGVITTNSQIYFERLKALRSHGIKRDVNTSEPWYYDIPEVGYNFRLCDFQCALASSQLNKSDQFLKRRLEIADTYNRCLSKQDKIKPVGHPIESKSSFHLYQVLLNNGQSRRDLYHYLKERQILCQVHYIPVYWFEAYKKMGFQRGICPNAEYFYDRVLSLPIFPKMNAEELSTICNALIDFASLKNNNA